MILLYEENTCRMYLVTSLETYAAICARFFLRFLDPNSNGFFLLAQANFGSLQKFAFGKVKQNIQLNEPFSVKFKSNSLSLTQPKFLSNSLFRQFTWRHCRKNIEEKTLGSYYGSDLNFSLLWDFCAQFQKILKRQAWRICSWSLPVEFWSQKSCFFSKNSWVFFQSPWLCTIYPKHWSFENLESDSF